VLNKLDPGEPVDQDLFAMSAEQLRDMPVMPATLSEALNELENDHEFLLAGGVFTKEAIESWIAYKRENEVDPVRVRPHPHEFELYFDA